VTDDDGQDDEMKVSISKLLVANRGEIAVRVMQTAAEMGIATVAVYARDDAESLACKRADERYALSGSGPAAYLDIDGIIEAAKVTSSDAVHPGYGFLSENAEFAQRCLDAGLLFVGPSPQNLAALGDKVRARELAAACNVPVALATPGPVDDVAARKFLESLGKGGAIAIKAVAGGGGRGIRIVHEASEVTDAWLRCRSEAKASFGIEDVYAEEFIPRARHIEVQIVGDAQGEVAHLGDRECSIQRNRQKLVEVAPAPNLDEGLREAIAASAVRLAAAARYHGIGTFEFLVRSPSNSTVRDVGKEFVFLEANPRIQVEHTVTEEITGLDLVRIQLLLAQGAKLADIGLRRTRPTTEGYAIQARINAESLRADGTVLPVQGELTVFEPPSGPGIRVDTAGHAGYVPNSRYDSLLAKVIVHSREKEFALAARKAHRALRSFRIDGAETNVSLLLAVLAHPEFTAGNVDTQFLERNFGALSGYGDYRKLYHDQDTPAQSRSAEAGTQAAVIVEDGTELVASHIQGAVIKVLVEVGQPVAMGQPLFIVEAMKMENEIIAPGCGVVRQLFAREGELVVAGAALCTLVRSEGEEAAGQAAVAVVDPSVIRPDLAEVLERRALWMDAARPEMVTRRHARHQRTTRENVADFCDEGSFHEYHGFVVAAQRARRTLDDLIRNTPADGQVCGVGRVNGDRFGDHRTQCAVVAYDYSVLAGTQGHNNHLKTDRMLEVALKNRIPAIFFAEGGGGRPGDTEGSWLAQRTFNMLPGLSGKVPTVGIASGYCFAGNAAIMGLCDVTIVTRGANIGMGGPVMIEAGGLGKYKPQQVGPAEEQVRSGVIDLLVENEAEAVQVAKKYLSYWQGPLDAWTCGDQSKLRGAIPMDRRRLYDLRALLGLLADTDSMLELRRGFGNGMLTAFIRVEGFPVGVIANDPQHLAGAIDSDGADKAARFMQLCQFYGIPLMSLVDTPGIMVGPEAERSGIIRHSSRLLAIGANLEVPHFVVVTRKAYGLGKVGMSGGAFRAARFSVSWPTAEFGPMNLEGSVQLAHRKELDAIADPELRRAEYERLVADAYEDGKALNRAMDLETDDVIDPALTRSWIVMGIKTAGGVSRTAPRERSFVDTW
jgi:acetyl/propionyl-CoA carboxylase alpha subunit/acetyl-CoA carboxylase carboxyltransferase component